MRDMAAALEDAAIDEPARSAMRGFFERASAYVVNQGEAPTAETGDAHPELAARWEMQRALDEAVASIRKGDAGGAVALAEGDTLSGWFRRDRAVHASLLAVMIASGDRALAGHV